MPPPTSSAEPAPTGVLLVNAWVEPEADAPLRARITWTIGVDGGHHVAVAATREDVLAVAEQWLDSLLGTGG